MKTTLPARLTTKAQGMPFCSAAFIHFSFMNWSSFFWTTTGYDMVAPICFTKGRTFSGVSSLTPTTTRPLGASSRWILLMCGIDCLHGPHQVAQNSTT